MQFVRSSVLKSVDGVYSTEKKTKHINAEGLDYFSNRDSFVSEKSVEKKYLYSTEIEQRGGHKTWSKNSNQNSVSGDDGGDKHKNEFGPATITQDEFEFLEFHENKKKKQELANKKAVEEFHKRKLFARSDDSLLDRIAQVHRNKEKEKDLQLKNTLKVGFGGLKIKRRKLEENLKKEKEEKDDEKKSLDTFNNSNDLVIIEHSNVCKKSIKIDVSTPVVFNEKEKKKEKEEKEKKKNEESAASLFIGYESDEEEKQKE